MKGEVTILVPTPAEVKDLKPGDLYLIHTNGAEGIIRLATSAPIRQERFDNCWEIQALDIGKAPHKRALLTFTEEESNG